MKNTEIERKWLVSGWPPETLPLTARQFMRQGYFCLDNRDAAPGRLVFNRSVSLKDSFKK